MTTIERKEKVKITYDGNEIIVKGKTFEIYLPVNSTSLASIYMSGSGEAEAKISVDVVNTQNTEEDVATPVSKRKRKIKTLDEVKAEQTEFKFNPEG